MESQIFYGVSIAILVIIALLLLFALYKLWMHIVRQAQMDQLKRLILEKELETASLNHLYKKSIEEYGWNGYRKFTVVDKVQEAEDICSFYLKPHDGKSLPLAKPGQYLTFRLNIPNQERPVIRCYSLSDTTIDRDYYRVTIKQIPPPRDQPEIAPGLSSSYFTQNINAGDILDVKAPSGHFYLDTERSEPVVLIGGGIGITPVLSMLNYLCETQSDREIWFFYGLPYGTECVFKQQLREINSKYDNVKLMIVFSRPKEEDKEGVDFDYKGHVNVDLFKQMLPSNEYDFYICGPPRLMNQMTEDLHAWGVPERSVHMEAFGPASVKQAEKGMGNETGSATAPVQVTFKKSNITVEWSGEQSLLELAESNNIVLDFGCRAGSCGTCSLALYEGDVDYPMAPDFDIEKGTCLACMAKPKENIVVDA
jgi:ferredoxin-NADP reductase